ncbi:MAG: hypothetical protein LBJ74_01400, partial [Heliobacteriaceae bacterium]|nr:hypothetical protein [Heliobacteriaceae bacterium]
VWYIIINYEKDEGLVPRWAETLNNAPLYDNGELPDLSSAIELASLFALSSALNLYDDLIANAENAIKNAIDGTYPYWGDSDTHAGQEAAVKQINDYYEGSKTKQTNIGTNITNLQTIVSQMPVGIRKTELGTLISQLQQISGATDSIVKKMETFNNTIGQWNASNAPYKQDSREIDKDIIRAAFGENSAWPKGGGTDWDKINNTDTSLPANRKGGVAKAIDDAKMTYSNTGIDQYQIQTQLEEKLNEFQWLDNYNTHAQQFVRWLNSCEQFKNYVQYGLETLPSKEIPRENDPKAQWYTNLWYRMGGISETKKEEPSTKFKVLDDSKMNNPDYLQYALETGTLAMEQVVFSEKGSGLYPGLKTTDWKACTFDNISNISRQDNTLAVAKAEVKYKKAVEEIQATDKRYDLDLKKLDTQHNALQTEFDSIKTIINKNAERSFKAFS